MTLVDSDHATSACSWPGRLRPAQRPGRNPEYQRVLDQVPHGSWTSGRQPTPILHGLGAQGAVRWRLRAHPWDHARVAAGVSYFGHAQRLESRAQGPCRPDPDRTGRLRLSQRPRTRRTTGCDTFSAGISTHGSATCANGSARTTRPARSSPRKDWTPPGESTWTCRQCTYGEAGRARQAHGKCTRYWIQYVLTWLTGQGMARPASFADDAWTLTERFRVHAREIALEHAYTFIADLAAQSGPDAERAQQIPEEESR